MVVIEKHPYPLYKHPYGRYRKASIPLIQASLWSFSKSIHTPYTSIPMVVIEKHPYPLYKHPYGRYRKQKQSHVVIEKHQHIHPIPPKYTEMSIDRGGYMVIKYDVRKPY
jgi:hypothetical protein